MVKFMCHLINHNCASTNLKLVVGSLWTLSSVRQEFLIALGDNSSEFNVQIVEGEEILKKVRHENYFLLRAI